MAKIELTKNDSGFDLEFIIKDANGVIVNLSGATVKFQLSTMKYANKINGVCTVTDEVAGECKYTFQTDDLNLQPGEYRTTLEVTWGTKIVSSSQFPVYIIPECG